MGKGEVLRTGSAKKKGGGKDVKSKASKAKENAKTVEISPEEIPTWDCTFVIDKELEGQVDIKIDTTLTEWLKKEKESWATVDDGDATAGGGVRSERAWQARQDYL